MTVVVYFICLFSGGVQNSHGTTLSMETLLDILIVLYDECQTPSLRREKRISEFVDFGRYNRAVLQIRRGKRDDLGIVFHITPLKCKL